MFTTRRIALVDGDRQAAEMLHMFFRLMELECSLIRPDGDTVPTVRRLRPDILIVDFDLPDLRALDIGREIRAALPTLPIIFLTDREPLSLTPPIMRKPHASFEESLRLFEYVLALGT
jgi:DNA-binding response OmpR family regulator